MTSAPLFVHCCHCSQCQRLTGSAFVLNALIETDRVQVLRGEVHRTDGPSESGRPHDIYRCPACQTAVWSDYGRRPALRFLRVGALDTPAVLPPDVHIFTRSKLPWVDLSGDPAVYEVYYDMQALRPADSLARRRAILGDG